MASKTQHPLVMTLATKNMGKRLELVHWLENSGLPIELALNESVGDIEESGRDFIENARIKAEQTPPVVPNGYVLAEDSGLVVAALDGSYGYHPFPGLHSNRWLTPEIRDELQGRSFPNRMALDRVTDQGVTNSDLCQGILALMQGKSQRTARYCCGMVLWHPERGVCAQALDSTELWGIEDEPRGRLGFGYDPIMAPLNEQGSPMPYTVAEMSTTEKNRISHRGKAFQVVLKALSALGI